jgi:hypothetical protein
MSRPEVETYPNVAKRGGLRQPFVHARFRGGRAEPLPWAQSNGPLGREIEGAPLLPFEHMMSPPANRSAVFFVGTHDPCSPAGPPTGKSRVSPACSIPIRIIGEVARSRIFDSLKQ